MSNIGPKDIYFPVLNTLRAGKWEWIGAKLFGRRHVIYDPYIDITWKIITWRGKQYFLEYEEHGTRNKDR